MGQSHRIAWWRASAAALFLFLSTAPPLAAEPRITLKLPGFPGAVFPNFSSVVVPANHGTIEIWLEDAVSEVQVSTVRVRLNEMPMTPFVTVNPLPRGVRLLLKQGRSMHPEYRLRPTGENMLSFSGADASKVAYQGQFYLTLDPTLPAPRAAPMRTRAPAQEVSAPRETQPPRISFTSEWPARTAEGTLSLEFEASDSEGLLRVVIEVNGQDLEEIDFQNELPVRKEKGWATAKKLAGEVSGDARRVVVRRPIAVDKDIMVVAVRAENALHLRTRIDRTVERIRIK